MKLRGKEEEVNVGMTPSEAPGVPSGTQDLHESIGPRPAGKVRKSDMIESGKLASQAPLIYLPRLSCLRNWRLA